jgi:hypothetical protein
MDDQRGTLNLITREVRETAAGPVILGWPSELTPG